MVPIKRMTMSGKSLQPLLVLVLLLSVEAALGVVGTSIMCSEKERQALLRFKKDLIDEYGLLSSWEDNKNCCNWTGVQCSDQTGLVIKLKLGAKATLSQIDGETLKGKISPSLLELEHLKYLDLSHNDFGGSPIPKFIGSLHKLTYLDLSFAGLGGQIPYQLGNLSSLRFIDLSLNYMSSASLEWTSHLGSLRYLDLSYLNLSKAKDWSQAITKLPSLTALNLCGCYLPQIAPDSIPLVNVSTSLAVLYLPTNNLDYAIHQWVLIFKGTLVDLDLSFNQLQGPVPESFGNLCRLKSLRLSSNNISQTLSDVFIALSGCTEDVLQTLDLGGNQLNGSLPDLTRFSSLRNLFLYDNTLDGPFTEGFRLPSTLDLLDLGMNEINGSLPDPEVFSSLRELHLGKNKLNGTIDEGLGLLSKLEVLDLSSNFLEGIMSQAHFSNLSSMQYLDLSYNSLTINISFGWVPPFQLDIINLCGCKLGPHFPTWLQTQNNYSVLDISSAGISGAVPIEFWDLSPRLYYLNLSFNQINGLFPSFMLKTDSAPIIDLSSNGFKGLIPRLTPNMTSLNLSKNKFSGSITFLCEMSETSLTYLDLSDNLLSGELPNCWRHLESLLILRLDHNKLSGNIPNSLGSLYNIKSLHLRNNSFTGKLPPTLSNCTQLIVLDLGENQFSSTIPTWIGENLLNLAVLSLRSNQFHGVIPSNLCHLSCVRILDLSQNNITGSIPKCISNFTGMTQKEDSSSTVIEIDDLESYGGYGHYVTLYSDTAYFVWKGEELEYKNTLRLVKTIDFSSNNLTGEIPSEITSLAEMIALNLSRNSLSGFIPPEIGQLELLECLDLSWNHIFGGIPASLSQINGLSLMDLSHNNLSGNIPCSTQLQSFNASAYAGNPELCGLPLLTKCQGDEATHYVSSTGDSEDINIDDDEDEEGGLNFDSQWVAVGVGFSIGFWGVCGTLLMNSSWRESYFRFLSNTKGWTHAMVVKHFFRDFQRG